MRKIEYPSNVSGNGEDIPVPRFGNRHHRCHIPLKEFFCHVAVIVAISYRRCRCSKHLCLWVKPKKIEHSITPLRCPRPMKLIKADKVVACWHIVLHH